MPFVECDLNDPKIAMSDKMNKNEEIQERN